MKTHMVLLLFQCVTTVFSQPSSIPFSRKLTVEKHAGLKFKFQVAAKTEIDDDSAMSILYFRTYDETHCLSNQELWDKPIRFKKWKIYTIEGNLDSTAVMFNFGFYCHYSANFYIDEVSILIKDYFGLWDTCYQTGFENGFDGWKLAKPIDPKADTLNNFSVELSEGTAYSGKQCAVVKSRDVPIYGTNNKVGRYIPVNGIKIYCEVFGKGHPLLVLHGNGGRIDNAGFFYNKLKSKYKIVAIDSRAHGRSTDNGAELTYELMASDINAVLDTLKIDSLYIWGHSDGGILGLIMAMKYPKKVSKLLATGANIMPDTSAICLWAFNNSAPETEEKLDPLTRRLHKLMQKHPNISYSALKSIKAPVLLVIGDRDIIRPEHAVKMFQNIPNSQLCIIPGATHMAAWEKSNYFLMILNDFFDKPFSMPDTRNYQ
jgi:pimeloyl-ACP methyl ester carboxylesterase